MAVSDNKKQKTNIMTSINLLFYVSFFMGIIPFSFNEYRKNKILKYSIWGMVYCIITLFYNFVQYHFAISNFLISTNADDGSGKFKKRFIINSLDCLTFATSVCYWFLKLTMFL